MNTPSRVKQTRILPFMHDVRFRPPYHNIKESLNHVSRIQYKMYRNAGLCYILLGRHTPANEYRTELHILGWNSIKIAHVLVLSFIYSAVSRLE